ncbi:MAG TPA: YbaK/EbsC family protein [Anaeromyxobacteraceae bacterium]|nr:YbaK/EbsC family protein [Anaeromyxobacteraceae bacterium]
MIPAPIETYLREHHLPFEHHVHARAIPAQMFAAAEHVSGSRVAKPVVVSLDGHQCIAVVSAMQKVDLEALSRATRARDVRLVPEAVFAEKFWPCEPGAEPPLGMFGMPIYVDAELAHEPFLVMRGGTHEDSIQVETRAWMKAESVHPVPGLGLTAH